jgi:hypothetical protein
MTELEAFPRFPAAQSHCKRPNQQFPWRVPEEDQVNILSFAAERTLGPSLLQLVQQSHDVIGA